MKRVGLDGRITRTDATTLSPFINQVENVNLQLNLKIKKRANRNHRLLVLAAGLCWELLTLVELYVLGALMAIDINRSTRPIES